MTTQVEYKCTMARRPQVRLVAGRMTKAMQKQREAAEWGNQRKNAAGRGNLRGNTSTSTTIKRPDPQRATSGTNFSNSSRGASTWAACSCQDSFLRGEQGAYRRSKVVLTRPACSAGLCRVPHRSTRPYAVPLRGQRARECERRDVGVCALETLCAQTSREWHEI